MSASLVGSEMCIRDRIPELPRGAFCAALRAESAGDDEKHRRRPSSAEICLLYTSDAADDM
eukprot:6568425-Alexandrium_andersonii.AAC.1